MSDNPTRFFWHDTNDRIVLVSRSFHAIRECALSTAGGGTKNLGKIYPKVHLKGICVGYLVFWCRVLSQTNYPTQKCVGY